jgi:hypothetical protein
VKVTITADYIRAIYSIEASAPLVSSVIATSINIPYKFACGGPLRKTVIDTEYISAIPRLGEEQRTLDG